MTKRQKAPMGWFDLFELKRKRNLARNPNVDAYGMPVNRGDALNPMPISQRWVFWKSQGWLSWMPLGQGWKAWRAFQAPCDRTTVSNLL